MLYLLTVYRLSLKSSSFLLTFMFDRKSLTLYYSSLVLVLRPHMNGPDLVINLGEKLLILILVSANSDSKYFFPHHLKP